MDYSRQLKLEFIDQQAQQKLFDSRVIVFGAGGLGCTALAYLAASGVGHITIVDADRIASHNLHRQILYTAADIGQSKAARSAQRIAAMNPQCRAQAIETFLTGAALIAQIEEHHLAIDCTDDSAFSLQLNKTSCALSKPAVFANASRMHGQLFVYSGNAQDACLCCLWGDHPSNTAQNCEALGVLGPVPGILGSLQAIEAIKLLIAHRQATALKNTLLQFDFLTHQYQKFNLEKSPHCTHHQTTRADLNIAVTPIFSGDLAQAANSYSIIDICNLGERLEALTVPHQQIPFEELIKNYGQYLSAEKNYLLVCQTGRRSRALQQLLAAHGLNNVSAFIPE